jgi:hypothetical protein
MCIILLHLEIEDCLGLHGLRSAGVRGRPSSAGVVALDVFHDSGGFGGVWFDTLAL